MRRPAAAFALLLALGLPGGQAAFLGSPSGRPAKGKGRGRAASPRRTPAKTSRGLPWQQQRSKAKTEVRFTLPSLPSAQEIGANIDDAIAAVPRTPDELKDAVVTVWSEVRLGQVLFGFFTAFTLFSGGLIWTGSVVTDFLTEKGRGEVVQRALLFGNILDSIREAYVEDNVDVDQLFQTGVNAMLGSLDPYSAYENARQSEDLTMRTVGRYGGVGLTIGNDNDDVIVLGALEGFAFDAGMRAGDKILTVDGEKVGGKEGLTVDDVKNRLRGQPGTQVAVVVRRDGNPEPELTFQLQRRQVRLRDISLAAMMDNGVGYVKLDAFSEGTSEEVAQAIGRLQGQGLKALVLDLRDNPGGLLEAAVSVSQQLVPEGTTIVTTAGRDGPDGPVGGSLSYRSVTAPLLSPDVRLVLVVNGNTASAAEIVSGVVQDVDRGVVVGQRSFGKGLVQVVEPLPGGAALKLTVAKYYTPSGRCIQAVSYRDGAKGERLKAGAPPAQSGAKDAGGAAPETPAKSDPKRGGEKKEGGAEGAGGGGGVFPPDEMDGGDEAYGGRRRQSRKFTEAERKTFYTVSGRPVKDGGGIVPDVVEKPRKIGELERILLEQGLFYRFAGDWLEAHKGYPAEQKQLLSAHSETAYQDFVSYVRKKQSSDGALLESPRLAAQLNALQKSLEASVGGAQGRASQEVDDLRKVIRQEQLAQFASQKVAIKEDVVEAVLGRITAPSERQLEQLDSDPQVKAALALASDPQRYTQILAPPSKADEGDAAMAMAKSPPKQIPPTVGPTEIEGA